MEDGDWAHLPRGFLRAEAGEAGDFPPFGWIHAPRLELGVLLFAMLEPDGFGVFHVKHYVNSPRAGLREALQ